MKNEQRLLKNKLLNYISYIFKLERNLGKPIIRDVEVTNACMMKCIMCQRKNMKRKVEFMDIQFFKKIIDQAKWNSHMTLHGFGDPLLHPKIIDMIKYCVKKNLNVWFSTNPNLLSEEMCKNLISSGLQDIRISLDGVDDKTYKYFRGSNADYKKAVENINNFLRIKKELNSPIKITLSMIRMKVNKNDCDRFKEIWMSRGANVLINQFGSADTSDKLTMEQGDEETFSDTFKKNPRYCVEPWAHISIHVDGTVIPCPNDCQSKYPLGNLKKNSLEEIWNNSRLKNLRKQFKENKTNENPLCKNCREKWGGVKMISIYNYIRKILSFGNKK